MKQRSHAQLAPVGSPCQSPYTDVLLYLFPSLGHPLDREKRDQPGNPSPTMGISDMCRGAAASTPGSESAGRRDSGQKLESRRFLAGSRRGSRLANDPTSLLREVVAVDGCKGAPRGGTDYRRAVTAPGTGLVAEIAESRSDRQRLSFKLCAKTAAAYRRPRPSIRGIRQRPMVTRTSSACTHQVDAGDRD